MVTQNAINGSIKVTTYSSSGTWTKDARTKFIEAYGFNSGRGAGAGTTGGTSGAGGNGASGKVVVIEFF